MKVNNLNRALHDYLNAKDLIKIIKVMKYLEIWQHITCNSVSKIN